MWPELSNLSRTGPAGRGQDDPYLIASLMAQRNPFSHFRTPVQPRSRTQATSDIFERARARDE